MEISPHQACRDIVEAVEYLNSEPLGVIADACELRAAAVNLSIQSSVDGTPSLAEQDLAPQECLGRKEAAILKEDAQVGGLTKYIIELGGRDGSSLPYNTLIGAIYGGMIARLDSLVNTRISFEHGAREGQQAITYTGELSRVLRGGRSSGYPDMVVELDDGWEATLSVVSAHSLRSNHLRSIE